MHKVLKTLQVRALDALAQERFAIPGLLLMEHASLGLAEVLLSLGKTRGESFAFICGRGNNGGDGLAAARHLHNRGASPQVFLLGTLADIRKGSDAAMNGRIVANMGIPIHESSSAPQLLDRLDRVGPQFVVDALLGTGLNADVHGPILEVIDGVNSRGLDVTAVEGPSGLDSDTGRPRGTAIRARRTVTFAFAKAGLVAPHAAEYCGTIFVKGIGLPRELAEAPEAFL